MKPTSSQPIRTAVYLRISFDHEMDGLTIDRRREDREKPAQFRGWEIVETYVDQSISASDKTKKRPGYLWTATDCEAGLLDVIMCYDLDQLTRQPWELEDWTNRVESRGLLLVTANGDADLAANDGRMYVRIKAVAARAEVECGGAHQSRTHVQRARQERPPKSVRPLGYAILGEVIEYEVETIKAIYAVFLRGDSFHDIARALSRVQGDGEGVGILHPPLHSRTVVPECNAWREVEGKAQRPVPGDKPWSSSTMLGIPQNPRYVGYSVYTSKDVRRQETGESCREALHDNLVKDEHEEFALGQWEVIVEANEWWAVQSLLNDPARVTNRNGSAMRKYLGAELFRRNERGESARTHVRCYICKAGHLSRTRGVIGNFVWALVMERLKRRDLKHNKQQTPPEVKNAFPGYIVQQRIRITRAERGYDVEVAEGADLARIRNAVRVEATRLEAEHLTSEAGTMLAPIFRIPDLATTFLSAPITL